MTREQLLQALSISGLAQSSAAVAALSEGWQIEVTASMGSYEELAPTYAQRLEQLRTKVPSAHAAQLAKSTEEFVKHLRVRSNESSGTWFAITGPAEHEFSVFCSSLGEPLGCLRTVSRLRVSAERWVELWAVA